MVLNPGDERRGRAASHHDLIPDIERTQAKMEARVAVDPSSLLDDFELRDADREATVEWR